MIPTLKTCRCGAVATSLLIGVMTAPATGRQDLVPDTGVRGPVLELAFPEIRIGIAEYAAGPTGATVFHFAEPVMATIDVRGGAPGVVNSDAIRLPHDAAFTRAVCFAGGSAYGLSAATGAAEAIKSMSDRPGHWEAIAVVPGAIIFDLGSRRLNAITPDAALGAAALRAARPGAFPLGAQGAGRYAMQGSYFGRAQHSGQGGAFRQRGQTKVAVFTVVNALGTIVDRDGHVVRCAAHARGERDHGACGAIADHLARHLEASRPSPSSAGDTRPAAGPTSNTTITLVVTNEKCTPIELQRLAVQVHGSMARAIQPFATENDGDTLIAVTTGQVETPGLSKADLGVLASEVAWDAVLASVPALPEPGPAEPVAWTDGALDEITGTYRFSRWASIEVTRDAGGLVARVPAARSLYFPREGTVRLVPVGADRLRIDHDPAYELVVERKGGRVVGLTLEPGPWGQFATRE